MSLFGKILSKLGIGDAGASPPASTAPPPPDVIIIDPAQASTPRPPAPPSPPSPPPRQAGGVDVVAELDRRAAANPQKLNWKTSIVDLLKLLDIDSSFAARKELATELGCPTELMADSAKMNMWLHREVLARVAANGGKVPADLLD